MSQHKKKITIRVTAQTAYHLEQMAQAAGASPGQIVDALTTAARKGGRKDAGCIEQLCLEPRRRPNRS